jgi:hypothetical protein
LIYCTPFLFLITCFILTDPFQNIFYHKVYFFDYMMLSRGNASTKTYLQNKDKYHYDSFIFGSSRSTAHTSKEWAKYLSKNNVPFSFGAWTESIEGVYRRIKLIDSLKSPIRNVLIIIDVDRTFAKSDTDKADDFAGDHYLITKKSRYDYYTHDFLYYLRNPILIITSIDYRIFKRKRDYMSGFIGMKQSDMDSVTNDWDVNSEKKILADSINYYKAAKNNFYKRPPYQAFAEKQITKKKELCLNNILAILKKHKTNYKIVIGPLYDQIKINSEDLSILNHVFGKRNLYDYSGINTTTNNQSNYNNDAVHYRKKVGDLIFNEIYR